MPYALTLDVSSTMIFFCFFALHWCSRINLAWLPEKQIWATREICWQLENYPIEIIIVTE